MINYIKGGGLTGKVWIESGFVSAAKDLVSGTNSYSEKCGNVAASTLLIN